jgi:ketosteroid isomerase-like protein
MSKQNVDVVRSLIEAWNRREPGVEAYHEHAEWDFTRSSFDVQHRWRGVEGMLEVFGQVLAAWEDLRFEPEDFVDAGDQVVVFARHHGRRRDSGLEVSDAATYVCALREGKIERFTLYRDRTEALEAVGLTLPEHARESL